jgi:spermidine synthase
MPAKTRLIAAALCLGFLSTTAQVIILRELLVAFTGNELTVATTLAFWLLSVAGGCFLFKRATALNDSDALAILFIIAGLAALFQVILIRVVHPLAASFGELLSPKMMVVISLLGVAPCAAVLGGLFVSLVSLADQSGERTPVARVYGIEAMGSGVAGVVLSLYLLEAATGIGVVALSAIVSLICAILFISGNRTDRRLKGDAVGRVKKSLKANMIARKKSCQNDERDASRRRMPEAEPSSPAKRVGMGTPDAIILSSEGFSFTRPTVFFSILAGLVIVLIFSHRIDLATRQIQWGRLDIVETVDSKYGSIVVTGRDSTFDFFESGVLVHSVVDPMFAEESAHVPLLYHPYPKRILVIGGAGSGIISEVSKHRTVDRIHFVELDPSLIQVTKRYAPANWLDAGGIEVTPIYGDGRRYVSAADESYDVVIIGVGPPVSLQMNRYYTIEFFQQVKEILQPDGILSLKIPSAGAYVGPDLGSLLSSLVAACRQVFEHVVVLPGDYIHVLASPDLELDRRTDVLFETMTERGISASYVNPYRLWERLLPMARAQIDSLIARYATGAVNSDSKPVSASYAIARWAKHFRSGRILSRLVESISVTSCIAFLVLSALVVCSVIVLATRSPKSALPGALALYSMGLTTMFTQILIILSFQIISGYMYGRIAALVASFMLGMGLASSLAGARRIGRDPRHLLMLCPWLAALPVAVAITFGRLGGATGIPPYLSDFTFIGLAFITGCLGGTIFAAASSAIAVVRTGIANVGAISYSADLCGATVAGFTTGFMVIPSLGITESAYAVAAANLILLIPLVIGGMAYRKPLPH